MTTYNHAFTFAFEIGNSKDPEGNDLTPYTLRLQIISKLNAMSDEDLLENLGAPFDTHEEEDPQTINQEY